MSNSIAVIGRAGSGKTTAAEYLADIHGYIRVSFAGTLKEVATHIWGPDARTDRDKLQKLGMAVREIDPNAWVNAALRAVRLHDEAGSDEKFVIDDCRFPNEYWALKELGFVFLQVQAPEITRIERLQRNGKLTDVEQLNHVSETALDDRKQYPVDRVITNNDLSILSYGVLIDEFLNHEARRT